MLDFQQINKLGEVFNTTFGRASGKGYGLKATFAGNEVTIKYHVPVYFASEQILRDQVLRSEEEANVIVNDAIGKAKNEYRDLTGETISLKEKLSRDSVEMVSASTTTARKVAYYRKFYIFEISN